MTSILSNSFWSTFHTLMSKGLRFFIVAFCIRMLGAYTWGQIASTLVTVSFLYLLVDLGLGTVPTLYKVADKSINRVLLRRISLIRLIMAIIIVVLIQAVHYTTDALESLLVIYSLVLIPRSLNLDWWFQRAEMYHVSSALQTLKIALFCLGAYFLLKPKDSAIVVIWIEMGSEAIGILISFFLMKKINIKILNGQKFDILNTPINYLHLLHLGFPMLIMSVLITIHQSVDILFLKKMCGYKAVGEYDVGYRIGYFLFFMGASIIQSIRPKLSRMFAAGDNTTILEILLTCTKILACLVSAFMLLSFYFSGPIVSLLFQTEGGLTQFVFCWAPVWILFSFMNMICSDSLLCMGEKRRYLIGAGIGAAVNIIANFVLISTFGERGSIFATILAELFFFIYAFFQLPLFLKSKLAGQLVSQATMGLLLVIIFIASIHWTLKWPFFCISILLFTFYVYLQGIHKPNIWVALRKN